MNDGPLNEDPLSTEDNTTEHNGAKPRESRRVVRLIGLLLIVASALLAWYLLVIYLGWQNGQVLLEEKRATTLTEQINTQLDLARQDIDAQKYQLAQRRIDWVLERSPNQETAQALLQEINSRQNQQSTPGRSPPRRLRPSPCPPQHPA